MTMLTDLRQGDLFLLGVKVIDRSIAGLQCTLFTTDRVALGSLLIAPDGTMTGNLSGPANTTPVTTLDRAFQPGDVVTNNANGETLVVRSVWITEEGWRWSSSLKRNSIYSSKDWTVIGSVTLT